MKRKNVAFQNFYQNGRLDTIMSSGGARKIFRSSDKCLAEHSLHSPGNVELLAIDINGSNLHSFPAHEGHPYLAYGYASNLPTRVTDIGFNGQHIERTMRSYLLGNGYRTYNPDLMRFHSPDSMSPFGAGGWNAYAYCSGDPINFTDPNGHMKRSTLSKPKSAEYYDAKSKNLIITANEILKKRNALSDRLSGANQRDYYRQRLADISGKRHMNTWIDGVRNKIIAFDDQIDELIALSNKAYKKSVNLSATNNPTSGAPRDSSASIYAPSAPRASLISNYDPSAPRFSIVSNYDPSAPRASIISDYGPSAPKLSAFSVDEPGTSQTNSTSLQKDVSADNADVRRRR
ncbi:RHS repeat-associated core domain-containing protein [Pseudomonas fulva]|uniref:RHS repeat-associated core domain-containing protein n=1 Tax=Pseudomonas fulva TaxID=47880 RepID=UPI001E2E5847|nr:RHS repeat-associated core domain-containing protein [Pseudomonas fulva]